MPLGNLTSQFFANVYLNELDQYVKHELKAKYYIRYVDDFVILDTNPKKLQQYKEKINNFLKNHLRLILHPTKTKILELKQGISFLGIRIYPHHKLLNKKNIRRFKKRLLIRSEEYQNEGLPREQVVDQFQGWLAYARNANTYNLRRNVTKEFNNLFPIEVTRQKINPKKHYNIQEKIEISNIEYTVQKTSYLFKRGLTVQEIARKRDVQESTIYKHLANLVAHNQIPLKQVVRSWKIKLILQKARKNSTLKEIKEELKNNKISYQDILLVLANQKGKREPKNLTYFLSWYQKTNCYRKCYSDPKQRELCKANMQLLQTKTNNLKFTKETFLEFIHHKTKICQLPEKLKHKKVSYQEFKKFLGRD